MNAQVNSLMLAYGILTIPAVLFFIALIVVAVIAQYTQGENQKRAQEKVIELTEKGHDAKLCSKCKGKGTGTWRSCPECGGLGYIFKLKESEESQPNADNKGGLQKCANCGETIGKLEKSYVFEDHVVCYKCHQILKIQK
jgi:RecJ-like exonuclease